MCTRSHWKTVAAIALLAASSAALSGCGWMARRLAAELALRKFERKFTVIGGKVTAFRGCLTSTGGTCTAAGALVAGGPQFSTRPLETNLAGLGTSELSSEGARPESAAEKALRHPVQTRLNQLYNSLSGLPAAEVGGFSVARAQDGGSVVNLSFSLREIDDYTRLLSEATQADGWNTLASQTSALAASSWNQVLTSYLAAYANAYFRAGQFFKIDAATDTALEGLRKRFPLLSLEQLKKFVASLDKPTFGSIGSTGFVTRTGAVYQFPALELRLDPFGGRVTPPSEMDLPLVAADLTRVTLEAVFDAHDRLPAVTAATGCGITAAPLPPHDPDSSPVSAEDFAEVTRVSNQAEAAVSGAVGPAIRGAGWASLNNDALAKVIETLVAVTVRKVTEKAAWCWYACELGAPPALMQPAERMDLHLVIGDEPA